MPIDVKILDRLRRNDPTLDWLDLSFKSLTDTDIVQLCEALKENTFLTTLRLDGNKIGDVGAAALAEIKTITTLKLLQNKIGHAGAAALANSTVFTELNLGQNEVDAAGENAIRDMLARNQDKADKLFMVCKAGNATEAQILLSSGVKPYGQYFKTRDQNGNTLLHTIISSQNLSLLHLALKHGAGCERNIQNKEQISPQDLTRRVYWQVGTSLLNDVPTMQGLPFPQTSSSSLSADGALIRESILDKLRNNDPTVVKLDLNMKSLTDADVIKLCEALEKNTYVTELNLSGNRIGDVGAAALAKNKTITKLDLSFNKIGDEGAKALANDKNLLILNLFHNQIGEMGAVDLAGNATLLKLNLSSNEVGNVGASAFAENTTLIALDLRCNQIGDSGAHALATNAVLKTLNLSGNEIGDVGASRFVENTTLIDLGLASNIIGDDGAVALAGNVTIKKLDLSNNHIGDSGAEALAKNPVLKILNLSNNHIQAIGASNFAENLTVIELILDNNKIGDEGAKAIARNKVFKTLSLYGNRIGELGACELAKTTTLVELGLGGNDIGDMASVAFSKNESIATLDLSNNKIGEEGVKALVENPILTDLRLRGNKNKDTGTTVPEKNTTPTTLQRMISLHDDAGQRAVIPMLERNQALTDKLLKACVSCDITEVKELLASGVKPYGRYIREKVKGKNTLLHTIVSSKNLELLRLALEYGAGRERDSENAKDETPIDLARSLNWEEGLAFLNGATSNITPQPPTQASSSSQSSSNIRIHPKILDRLRRNDPTLVKLDLSYQSLTDADIIQLCEALKGNTNLKVLDLVRNEIGDEGAVALAKNSTLTELRLSNNQIGDEGAKALAKNTTLTYLSLKSNLIGDDGAVALAKNTTLIELALGKNQIGDKGATALAKNAALTSLDLDNNQIGDEGAVALAENTTFIVFGFENNQISDRSRNAITVMGKRNIALATDLVTACVLGNFSEAQKLLTLGVKPYGDFIRLNNEGYNTLLHTIVSSKNLALLRLVLEYGAGRERDAKNGKDETPIDLARSLNWVEGLALLNGATSNITPQPPTQASSSSQPSGQHINASGIDMTEYLPLLADLKASYAAMCLGLESWTKQALKDAVISAELDIIAQDDEVKAYYALMKGIIGQTLMAATVILSDKFTVATGNAATVVDGLCSASGIPLLGLLGVAATSIDANLTYREMRKYVNWASLEEIPEFADMLARRAALARQAQIKAGLTAPDNSTWNKIKDKSIGFLEKLKNGTTYSEGERKAVLDAEHLLAHMMSVQDDSKDGNLNERTTYLMKALVGQHYVYKAPAHKGASTLALSASATLSYTNQSGNVSVMTQLNTIASMQQTFVTITQEQWDRTQKEAADAKLLAEELKKTTERLEEDRKKMEERMEKAIQAMEQRSASHKPAAPSGHYSDDSDEEVSSIQVQSQSTLPRPKQSRRADKDKNLLIQHEKQIAELQSGHAHVGRTLTLLMQKSGESFETELEDKDVNKQNRASLFGNT